jgi:hypothetical protein
VEAFDKAERSREFRPPLFIDARLRRQGRAKGFVGNAFRDLVGVSRYRWMQDLGNLAIATGSGGVQIKNPAAVADLVDLALHAADERRSVIFYCAYEFPSLDGALACHRRTIADLLLAHAKRIGRSISVLEWPGDAPTETRISVDKKMFSAITRGRMSVPFADDRLPAFAALPWASMLTVECGDSSLSPELNWDGQNHAREAGEALIREIVEAKSLEDARHAAERLKAMSRPFLNWAGKAERLSWRSGAIPARWRLAVERPPSWGCWRRGAS